MLRPQHWSTHLSEQHPPWCLSAPEPGACVSTAEPTRRSRTSRCCPASCPLQCFPSKPDSRAGAQDGNPQPHQDLPQHMRSMGAHHGETPVRSCTSRQGSPSPPHPREEGLSRTTVSDDDTSLRTWFQPAGTTARRGPNLSMLGHSKDAVAVGGRWLRGHTALSPSLLRRGGCSVQWLRCTWRSISPALSLILASCPGR